MELERMGGLDEMLLENGSGSAAGHLVSHWPWPWDQPGSVSPQLTLGMALVCLVSELLYGATSFGPAITFNCGWQIMYMLGLGDGTLTTVAIHMTVMEIFSAGLQVILLRKLIDPWLLVAIAVPTCFWIYVGQLYMIELDGVWLKRTTGLILFLMMAQRVWANKHLGLPCSHAPRPQPETETRPESGLEPLEPALLAPSVPLRRVSCGGLDLRRPKTLASVVFWFSMAGVLGGITSIGGPPMMLFVSIHADEVYATTAVCGPWACGHG
jgi:uncharacterized membrane protein YfcA